MNAGGGDAERGAPSGRRAQSETIGVVLLLAIAVTGVVSVVALGGAALDDTSHAMRVGGAEHAMTEFDSEASLVAHGESAVQRALVPTGNGARVAVADDAGRMRVAVVNRTTDAVELEVINTTLGAVTYENGDTTVAYQGGGVWRSSPGGASMVSPPEFHYNTNTLTLPLVLVEGDGTLDRRALVRKSGGAVAAYPNLSAGRANPLTEGELSVTVESDYYRAWGRFFETRTGGAVSYDDPNETVTIDLVVPSYAPSIAGGIVSGANGETLTVPNKGGVDSYNSSVGPYSATAAQNTSIVAAGSVSIENQGLVEGDLVVGQSVTIANKGYVTGNVSYGGALSPSTSPSVGGWYAQNATVETPDSVSWVIDEKQESFEESNDNGATSAISGEALQNCGSTCELRPGDYYLQNVSLGNGDVLELNTTSGPVEIAVAGDVALTNDAEIRVVGASDEAARFYVGGGLDLGQQSMMTVPDDRAPRLWAYLGPGEEVTLGQNAHVTGVLYGPGGDGRDGVEIEIGQKATVYGGLVGAVQSIPQRSSVHFDEALLRTNPLDGVAGSAPQVTYLHVSLNTVNVTQA